MEAACFGPPSVDVADDGHLAGGGREGRSSGGEAENAADTTRLGRRGACEGTEEGGMESVGGERGDGRLGQ